VTSEHALTINAGSSTIKVGAFAIDSGTPEPLGKIVVELRNAPLPIRVIPVHGQPYEASWTAPADDFEGIVRLLVPTIREAFAISSFLVVGHRIVHGGLDFRGPVAVRTPNLDRIKALIPLAPLHQHQGARLIEAIGHVCPGILQTASFDTTFHLTLAPEARRFAIPRDLHEVGVRRYGFHGISYAHIARALARDAPDLARGRVVVAHLGNGASLCALDGGVSKDTTMGFSTLDGVPMGTRCGALDPGALLYLLKSRGMSAGEIETLLYERSGLSGLSGISSDVRVLQADKTMAAAETLDVFTFHIARNVAALATTLQGLDGLVFTGGIGEHNPGIRAAVCARLRWLGVRLDENANTTNAMRIQSPESGVAVLVIPADEEQQIAADAVSILHGRTKSTKATGGFA